MLGRRTIARAMEEKRILRRRPEDHHFWLFFASLNAFARPRAPTFRSPRMVRTFTHNNEYYCTPCPNSDKTLHQCAEKRHFTRLRPSFQVRFPGKRQRR